MRCLEVLSRRWLVPTHSSKKIDYIDVQIEVTYGFTNRTPDMKLSRGAYKWLLEQMKREFIPHLQKVPTKR